MFDVSRHGRALHVPQTLFIGLTPRGEILHAAREPLFFTSGISKNSTKTIYLASYGSPAPLQIGICGANAIGVLDFSPTFIIKACHQ